MGSRECILVNHPSTDSAVNVMNLESLIQAKKAPYQVPQCVDGSLSPSLSRQFRRHQGPLNAYLSPWMGWLEKDSLVVMVPHKSSLKGAHTTSEE